MGREPSVNHHDEWRDDGGIRVNLTDLDRHGGRRRAPGPRRWTVFRQSPGNTWGGGGGPLESVADLEGIWSHASLRRRDFHSAHRRRGDRARVAGHAGDHARHRPAGGHDRVSRAAGNRRLCSGGEDQGDGDPQVHRGNSAESGRAVISRTSHARGDLRRDRPPGGGILQRLVDGYVSEPGRVDGGCRGRPGDSSARPGAGYSGYTIGSCGADESGGESEDTSSGGANDRQGSTSCPAPRSDALVPRATPDSCSSSSRSRSA